MLKVRLFGACRADYDGQMLVGFPNQQAFLLLCYLMLNSQSHYREQLAAVFWEAYETPVSRKHLSQTLWRLRQAFQTVGAQADDFLAISKESIAFNPASDYWLDVAVFETTIEQYQNISGRQLTPAQASDLEQAIELYTGDLLEGLYSDWCLYDRERLNLLHLETLGKLMAFHEHHRSYRQGVHYGERILNHDNTRERIHQQMMRLHWLAGNRSAAIAQFKRCVQILREELSAPPMLETTHLYEQILHNRLPSAENTKHPHDTALSPLVRSDDTLPMLAKQSLKRIARLQAIVEETGAELRHLERLIRTALLNSKEP